MYQGREDWVFVLLDGDGIFGVGRDLCGWVSDRLCAQGSSPSSCICQYPEMGCDLLLLFPWWIVFCCESHWGGLGNPLVFLSTWPDDECVVHISIPAGRLVCGFFYCFRLEVFQVISHFWTSTYTGRWTAPLGTKSIGNPPTQTSTYTKNPVTQPTNTQSSRPWYTKLNLCAIRNPLHRN